jgi:hypothetical protein
MIRTTNLPSFRLPIFFYEPHVRSVGGHSRECFFDGIVLQRTASGLVVFRSLSLVNPKAISRRRCGSRLYLLWLHGEKHSSGNRSIVQTAYIVHMSCSCLAPSSGSRIYYTLSVYGSPHIETLAPPLLNIAPCRSGLYLTHQPAIL